MTLNGRWYIGHKRNGDLVALQTVHGDLESHFHGAYFALTGPFRTKRAALWAEKYGRNNPHFQCVADAERISKESSK